MCRQANITLMTSLWHNLSYFLSFSRAQEDNFILTNWVVLLEILKRIKWSSCVKVVKCPFKTKIKCLPLLAFKCIIYWICCSLIIRSAVGGVLNEYSLHGRMPGTLYAATRHLVWLAPPTHVVCVGKTCTNIGCCRLSSCTFSGHTRNEHENIMWRQ